MKNLPLIVLMFFALLLSSCDPEYFGWHDCPPQFPTSGPASELLIAEDALVQRNWQNTDPCSFIIPIVHGGDVVYYSRDLTSIDMLTGITNWTLDLGYNPRIERAVQVDGKLYLIRGQTILGVNLDTGEIILEHEWDDANGLMIDILIDDGIVYVYFSKNREYYSYAYCSLDKINADEWRFLNYKIVDRNFKDKEIATNTKGEKLIITITTEGSGYPRVQFIEAFNASKNTLAWEIEEQFRENLGSPILAYKDQVIIRGNDYVKGLDVNTGEQLWKRNTRGNVCTSFSDRSRTMHIYENMLFLFSIKDIVTAYDLDNNGQEIWKANSPIEFDFEEGILAYSFNIVDDKMYYISAWGFLVEVELETGALLRHHEEYTFRKGLVVTEEKECIAVPNYNGRLMSFNLE